MRIYVISPFRGDIPTTRDANRWRAQQICRAIMGAGHLPFAPHLFFPQFLDDDDPEQRAKGIMWGHELLMYGGFERAWYYPKRGGPIEDTISMGMQEDIDAARAAGIVVERGTIGGDL